MATSTTTFNERLTRIEQRAKRAEGKHRRAKRSRNGLMFLVVYCSAGRVLPKIAPRGSMLGQAPRSNMSARCCRAEGQRFYLSFTN
jgi:hypothetical protein